MEHTGAPVDGATGERARRRVVAGMALVAMLLAVAACGDDDDGGGGGSSAAGAAEASEVLGPEAPASGEPVKVGLISDGSTPALDNSIELDVGSATVEYLNQHRSGIGGRPIELVTCETQAEPGIATDCANRMVEEDVVGVVVGSSAILEAVWEPLHAADVPTMLYAGSAPEVAQDPESTFILSNSRASLLDIPISVAEEHGESKVTIVVIDVPAALGIYDRVAPPVFEEAGMEMEVIAVPAGTADMTPQMQDVVEDDPGVVQVVGNDSFCISAFQGLQTAGFEGPVTSISQCITDATREAVPADFLDGMVVSATAPVGVDSPDTQLYEAVVETYGSDIDTSRIIGMNMFITLASFAAALEDISGEITAESVVATIKAMPERELPGSGGLTFQCNGQVMPSAPAVCTAGTLLATLDENGEPASYEVVGDAASEG